MMLPRRVATRFRLTIGVAALAIAAPAFSGLDRLGDGEAKRTSLWRWTPTVPLSLGVWRPRVGSLQETVREFIERNRSDNEAAHPLGNSLFSAEDGALPPIVANAPTLRWSNGAKVAAKTAASLLGDNADAFIQAVAFYKAGDFLHGDEDAARIKGSIADAAARWVALRLHAREAGFKRISAFLAAHPTLYHQERSRPVRP